MTFNLCKNYMGDSEMVTSNKLNFYGGRKMENEVRNEELKNEEVVNETVNEEFDEVFEEETYEMSSGECFKQIGRNVKRKVTDKETWKRIGKRVVRTAVGIGAVVGTIAVAGAIANRNNPALPDNGGDDDVDDNSVDMDYEISEDGQTMICRIVGDDAESGSNETTDIGETEEK